MAIYASNINGHNSKKKKALYQITISCKYGKLQIMSSSTTNCWSYVLLWSLRFPLTNCVPKGGNEERMNAKQFKMCSALKKVIEVKKHFKLIKLI